MLEILKEWMESQKFVDIYTSPEKPTKFIYGRILAVNTEHVAIYMLSTDGGFDGVVMRPLSDVYRVDVDNQYETVMQKLRSLHHEQLPEFVLDNEQISHSLLTIAQQTQRVVSLVLKGSDYYDLVGLLWKPMIRCAK